MWLMSSLITASWLTSLPGARNFGEKTCGFICDEDFFHPSKIKLNERKIFPDDTSTSVGLRICLDFIRVREFVQSTKRQKIFPAALDGSDTTIERRRCFSSKVRREWG